jgi:hypothetical protein
MTMLLVPYRARGRIGLLVVLVVGVALCLVRRERTG